LVFLARPFNLTDHAVHYCAMLHFLILSAVHYCAMLHFLIFTNNYNPSISIRIWLKNEITLIPCFGVHGFFSRIYIKIVEIASLLENSTLHSFLFIRKIDHAEKRKGIYIEQVNSGLYYCIEIRSTFSKKKAYRTFNFQATFCGIFAVPYLISEGFTVTADDIMWFLGTPKDYHTLIYGQFTTCMLSQLHYNNNFFFVVNIYIYYVAQEVAVLFFLQKQTCTEFLNYFLQIENRALEA
ncbi:hypothetical protein ACJX0J_009776, partial [Zea mays]